MTSDCTQETLCHHPVGKSLISSSIESQSKSFFGKSVQWGRVLWCLWNVFRLRQVWLPSFSSKRRQDEKMKVLFTKKEKLPDSVSNPSLNDQMALCTYESGSSGWDSFMSIDSELDWRLKTGVKSTLFFGSGSFETIFNTNASKVGFICPAGVFKSHGKQQLESKSRTLGFQTCFSLSVCIFRFQNKSIYSEVRWQIHVTFLLSRRRFCFSLKQTEE